MKNAVCFFVFCSAILVSSCAMFDTVADVSILLEAPDKMIVKNNARVSTLKSIEGSILRSGTSVYRFHSDLDLTVGLSEEITIDDFVIQDGDTASLTGAEFSHDI